MKMEYTKEEVKKIKETLEHIVDDLFEISKSSPKNIVCQLGTNSTELRIYDKQIFLRNERNSLYVANWENQYHLTLGKRRSGTKIQTIFIKDAIDLYIQLMAEYDEIRKKVAEEVKKHQSEKEEKMAIVDSWYNKFNNNVVISIESPPTNNQQVIEIREEEGLKIGCINFGRNTIKLVTEGNFVLENKSSKPESLSPLNSEKKLVK